jgi:hypothetical protein
MAALPAPAQPIRLQLLAEFSSSLSSKCMTDYHCFHIPGSIGFFTAHLAERLEAGKPVTDPVLLAVFSRRLGIGAGTPTNPTVVAWSSSSQEAYR